MVCSILDPIWHPLRSNHLSSLVGWPNSLLDQYTARFTIGSWWPALAVAPQLLCSGFLCHWPFQRYPLWRHAPSLKGLCQILSSFSYLSRGQGLRSRGGLANRPVLQGRCEHSGSKKSLASEPPQWLCSDSRQWGMEHGSEPALRLFQQGWSRLLTWS